MRELTMMELEHVSGAGVISRVGAAGLGAILGLVNGVVKGGVAGGSAGGLLGVGVIGGLVTMVVGGIIGPIAFGAYGLVNDWDRTLELYNKTADQWADFSIVPKV
jgi:hypothetical protein